MRWMFQDGATEDRAYAQHILERMQDPDVLALAPAVWPLEVGNVIVRAEAKNLLSEARSAVFLALLQDMAIQVEPISAQRALSDTLQLARRYGLSSYDASYLELALREGLPLATNDQKLRQALEKAGGALA